MTCVDGSQLIRDMNAQQVVIKDLSRKYPFVDVIYSLDLQGVQLLDSVFGDHIGRHRKQPYGKGSDRSHRPYMQIARHSESCINVTQPYLSSATHNLAISCIQKFSNSPDIAAGYLVLNFNLEKLISYLNGDGALQSFHPLFRAVYGLIGAMLICVSAILLFSAGGILLDVFTQRDSTATSTFGSVVIITLALAIFDLGKTILEEEVLTQKDISHHDTSRRTITRFMTAIVIAISIESLLLMFKSILEGTGEQVVSAVWMLFAAVALLSSLGVYLKLSKE